VKGRRQGRAAKRRKKSQEQAEKIKVQKKGGPIIQGEENPREDKREVNGEKAK